MLCNIKAVTVKTIRETPKNTLACHICIKICTWLYRDMEKWHELTEQK